MTTVNEKTPKQIGNLMIDLAYLNKERAGEFEKILTSKFQKGFISPTYGRGVFVNHITLDLFTLVGLCGMQVTESSSSRIVTPLGKVCTVCKSRYNKALTKFFTEKLSTYSDEDMLKMQTRTPALTNLSKAQVVKALVKAQY